MTRATSNPAIFSGNRLRLLISGQTAVVRGLLPRWAHRLGVLLTPQNGNRVDTVLATQLPWSIDNGAYRGLDLPAFRRLLARAACKPGLLWIAVPDVVGDAKATRESFERCWIEVAGFGPLAYVGQDGAEAIEHPWECFRCWFVGGTDKWKLSSASASMVAEAQRRGKLVHVGRVNSMRRLQAAFDLGVDSVDGSGMSKFGKTYIRRYCAWIEHLEVQGVLY